jgi:AcrR family transcriptional regulator
MSPARSADVRTRLLAAARAELVEHGRAAISLRAVARRAGLSHASPKYHFADRAGLLTAIATEGFQALAQELDMVTESDPGRQLAALGRAYIDFGLTNPALFELMFSSVELHADAPDLVMAQQRAIEALSAAVSRLAARRSSSTEVVPDTALIAWSFVHGLVTLARSGALDTAASQRAGETVELAHSLIDAFVGYLRTDLARRPEA